MRDDLLGAFLDELAERVAARLSENGHTGTVRKLEEPWRLWTLAETAERLTRSQTWVRKKARSGELPSVRLDGGALAFDPSDVRAFARERRIGPEIEEPARGVEWWESSAE